MQDKSIIVIEYLLYKVEAIENFERAVHSCQWTDQLSSLT